ncbi:MAG TPA: pyridoxamine 5'-phosphate oxidase family protein [Tepidisphaeraceae bacterium]|jgi:general stress protein 26
MDSINHQQSEQTHQDLTAQDAIQKVRELIKQSPTCFFCTAVSTGQSEGARPMSVQQVDDQGNLWFLSAMDSHKNQELMMNAAVTLYFQGSAHSDFLQLNGTASISQDKAKIKELWEPIVKNWFTQGMDDPRISVIKVTPADGYYWDTKHGHMIAGMKMMIGSMLGKTMDDSIEGRLDMRHQ